MKHDYEPWKFLDEYRGKAFKGQWPTLPEVFGITASRYPDRWVFSCFDPTDMRFTYREAEAKVKSLSSYLVGLGVKKGDKIGLTGKNSPEWAMSYLSILYAGGIVVPLDYQLKTEEMQGLMDMAEVKILFVDEEKYDFFADQKKHQHMVSLSPAKPNYVLDIPEHSWVDREMPEEADLAAILFTSGTTGVAKGVMLTHQNFVSDCYLAQANMNIFHSDVFYALLPLHHSYAMLAIFIESISVGAEVIFAKRVVVPQMLKDFKKGKVTMFLSIPMLFNKIIKALMKGIREKGIVVYGLVRFLMSVSGLIKKLTGINPGKKMFKGILAKVSLDNNRICICGGGPLPSSTFKLFNQLGIDFVQGYGLTETSPIIALNPKHHYKEASVGKYIPQADFKIADPDEEGNGEILVKGPMVMQGYYKNEEATAASFTADGYLKTGDAGHLDSEGYLYLTGRKKNLIVTEGGKNVFPEEIEDKFQLVEEINQILVKGYVEDAKTKAERIEAFIYPEEEWAKDKTPEEIKERLEAIISQVNKELRSYQKIERLKVLDEPMEVGGTLKIKRYKVE
jgi:long-chain acyl-CoA synthetase